MNQQLTMNTKTFHYVEYYDFEKFVNSVYPNVNYEFAADVESMNDVTHEYTVNKNPEMLHHAYDKSKWEKFITTGKGSYMVYSILEDLANRELIPEGNYAIRVSW